MNLTTATKDIQQGKTVDFTIASKKYGCFLTGTIIFMSIIFLGSIGLFIFYGFGATLEASAGTFCRGGAVGSTFVSGVVLFVIYWTVFRHPSKVFSVTKEELILYDKPTDVLAEKNPSVHIPWHEILDMKAEVIEEKFGHHTSCIVLKCDPFTVQKVQQHREQVWDEISKTYSFPPRHLYEKTYEIINDLIKINISSWLIEDPASLLTFLQELHKEAVSKP